MRFKSYFFFISLSLITELHMTSSLNVGDQWKEKYSVLEKAAKHEYLVQSEQYENKKSLVYVGRKVCNIFHYDEILDAKPGFFFNTLIKLYTCLSCQFALWIQHELFQFVKPYPMLYHRSFMTVRKNQFMIKYDYSIAELNRITKFTDRFTDILFNLRKSVNADLQSIDTYFLKSLMTLSFKLEKLKEPLDDKIKARHTRKGTDITVIRTVLDVINDVQGYLLLHCNIPLKFDQRVLHGYTVNGYDNGDGVAMDFFLNSIQSLALESSAVCTANEMLLVHRRVAQNEIASRVAGVRIDLGDTVTFTIEEFLNETAYESYTPEDVYVYVNFVFSAVMKLLCTKIVRHLAGPNELTAKTRIAIGTIRKQFIFGFTEVPADVIGCFERLQRTEADRLTANEKAEVTTIVERYLQGSLRTISLDQSDSDGDAVLKSLDEMSLDDFVTQLTQEMHHYRCFFQLYEVLKAEYNKPYLPFVYDPMNMSVELKGRFSYRLQVARTRIHPKEMESDIADAEDLRNHLIDEGCGFVIELYSKCFWYIVEINNALNEERHEVQYFQAAYLYLAKVIDYLLEVVPLYPQQQLWSITSHVMPYFYILKKEFNNGSTHHHQTRIVNIIMTELNIYGLKHCHPPKYNFLLFNNMGFDFVNRIQSSRNSKKIFLESINIARKMFSSVPDLKKMVNTGQMFDAYYMVFTKKLYKYTNRIQIFWRGNKEYLKKINDELMSTVLRFNLYYAYSDLYFKIVIGILFYELSRIPTHIYIDEWDDVESYTYDLLNNNKILKDFPDRFQVIIGMLKSYLPLLNPNSYNYRPVIAHKDRIEVLLADIGVFVELFKDFGVEKGSLLEETPKRCQCRRKGVFITELKQLMIDLLRAANKIITSLIVV